MDRKINSGYIIFITQDKQQDLALQGTSNYGDHMIQVQVTRDFLFTVKQELGLESVTIAGPVILVE